MKVQYDKSADVLYVTLRKQDPKQCRFVENENGDVLKIDRLTGHVVGVTIIAFLLRINRGLEVNIPEIRAIPFAEFAKNITGHNTSH
jgi:uncharacterized protein YuzE